MGIVAVETIGLDLGDRSSYFVKRDESQEIVARGKVSTRERALVRKFRALGVCRVVMEAGSHSGWVSRLLIGLGNEVVVANPREIPWLTRNQRKTDRTDAELLARVGQLDPEMLNPIEHRELEKQEDLTLVGARDQLVKTRTSLINHVRGVLKSMGIRVGKCSTEKFAREASGQIPETLKESLGQVVQTIGQLSQQIKAMDKTVLKLCKEKYPETELLTQVRGVGPLTALAYVLIVGSPGRFKKNRSVGAYLGLVRRLWQSGDTDAELGITKAGNGLLRRLLVGCSQYMMGHFGEDSDLRRHGEKLAAKGGKAARKKAVVAVARKLSVVLLHLWRNGEVYEPLYNANTQAA